ncbi:MAG: type I DNA topoisomerase [Beijerinckiaceae bacterium]|nr:type I DNA topoisomerase [Beijerinckiaceae bacterium]
MTVVIVESPSKAKTINKYLGSNYDVVASYGHVRDLPSKDGSVDPEADFAMVWELDGKSSKRMSDIAKMVKDQGHVILATDPDREGEAISWHLLEILRQKKALKDVSVQRVTFNAITKQAVLQAMAEPRDIDQALVDAYLARRALDYLVGFRLSPVLWRKLPGSRSAGRVQSVALRIVCDREMEIEKFVKREYWSLAATLATPKAETFEARLVGADGKKIARLDVGTEAEAKAFRSALEVATFRVTGVEAKPAKRHPYPPFTTSTLQQEASRKLGIAPAQTMRIAQKLYEGVEIGGETVGLITYMRTDGVQMAGEAVAAVRRYIGSDIGEKYLPKVPRAYSTKAKNAQEAHEAIRPTDVYRSPDKVRRFLDPEAARLYDLIWKRTVASQMETAEFERTTVDIEALAGGRVLELRATGQVVKFDGFLTLYTESRDDDAGDEDSARLPAMSVGDALQKREIVSTQHFTEPPPRYTEASLVKRMEELGIGRPSTYAATIAVLVDREYVSIDKKRLIGEDKGRLVTAFLESFFKRYVEYDFTADLENQLDRISNHEIDWKEVLRDFWRDFSAAIDGTKELRTTEVLNALNDLLEPHIFPAKADGGNPRACPRCGTGVLSLKLSKTGPFIGCTNYPECRYTRPFAKPAEGADGATPAGEGGNGIKMLGVDPDTKLEVTLRDGRFGPYVQLGEGDKPKRQSVPKGVRPAEVDLAKALQLLSLPRTVGLHPETGEPILASLGKYGPYVQHGKTYANIGADEDVLTIGLNRAVDLIVTKETAGPRGRFGRAAGAVPAGRVLGDHPDGGAITVRDGKYGPYVNWGKINATLPKATAPETVTLDQAVAFLLAKVEAGGGKKPATKKPPAKSASAKKAPAKKASVKKSAAGKAPAKTAAAS